MKKFGIFLIPLLLFYGCKIDDNSENVQYFPFQETEKGLWGMISPKGEQLFTEEFKEKPTIVRDNRFMVRNEDGFWEIFTAEAKPQKIGSEYAFASMFQNGVALVSEKNKPVSIINTEGKIIKVIDKIDGKTVEAVQKFSEGYAVFKTEKYFGVINEKGDKVIDAKYLMINACSDGKFIALDKKYEDEAKKDTLSNIKFDVLNTSGKILFSISYNKYKDFGASFHDGLLDVYTEAKDEKCGGIISDKGEVVVKPTPKIKKVGEIKGEVFTYNNGNGWGLMNLKGESIIRAKYDLLYFASKDKLIAVTKKNGDSFEYKYIDFDDNQIGEDTYDDAFPFDIINDENAIVQISASMYSIIDVNGKQIEKLPDIVHVGFSEGDQIVESDFVDMKVLIDALNLSANGVDSLTFASTPKQVVSHYTKQSSSWEGDADHKKNDPYWYTYRDEITYFKDVKDIYVDINVYFTGNLSRNTYRTKRVIDYEFEDWYWYHDEKIPTGYAFNNVSIKSFKVVFENNSKLRHKLKQLFLELSSRFKKIGKVEKENNGAVIVTLNNSHRALVAMEKDKVFVLWGNIKQANSIDISEYENVKEEAERIHDYDYFENKLNGIIDPNDTIEAVEDTTAVIAP